MNAPATLFVVLPSLQGGGAERVVLTLLRHLDRARFRPALVVLDGRDPAYAGDVPADVELIDLGRPRVRRALPALLALLRRRRPDVVLSVISHLNLGLALLRPLLPRGTRLVARETVVVSELLADAPSLGAPPFLYRRLYRRFDRIICQSRDMRDDLVARYAVPPARTVVIHNPIDAERIAARAAEAPAPEDATFLARPGIHLVAAGRLTRQKGFDLLLDALARTGDPRLHLTILGDGPLRAELEADARARGLGDRVRFAGFRANPYPLLRCAAAFVLSSRYEGLPNVVLEALACGTPVIATPAPGGTRELLDGRPGCAVAAAISAEALAAALAAFPFEARASFPAPDMRPFAAATIAARYADVLAGEAA